MIAKTAFRNGHHESKGYGDNLYRGALAFLPPPAPIADAEEAAERMFTDGCLQFPDVLDRSTVARLRGWMALSGKPDSAYEVKDWCFNKHIAADFQREPNWLTLIDPDPIYDVLALILGAGFRACSGSLWVTGRGRQMGMHVDHMSISLPEDVLADPRVRVPIGSCTLHYYLDDQVEEIGPTLVIPGSHKAGRPPHDEPTWHGIAPKMVSVKAGGAMLFRHDLWHGAAMNASTRRRYMIQVHFGDRTKHVDYPPMSQAAAYGAEVLARATARQRALLGDGAQGGIFY